MHPRTPFLWSLVIFSLLLAACGLEKTADGEKAPAAARPQAELGKAVPDFALKDQDGKPVRLHDLRGKIVVLEWINLECPFVQRHYEEGTFKAVAAEYAPKGVAWLAVNSTHWAKSASNRDWHARYALSYPILDDSAGDVGRLIGAKTTPHMFVIDREGRLAYSGAVDDDATGDLGDKRKSYIRQALDEVLAGNAPAIRQTPSYG